MKTYTSKAGIKRVLKDIAERFNGQRIYAQMHDPVRMIGTHNSFDCADIQIDRMEFGIGGIGWVKLLIGSIAKAEKNDLPVYKLYLRDSDTYFTIARIY